MRSVRGSVKYYYKRQVRREVYKVCDSYMKNKYLKSKYIKENNVDEEISIFGILFYGLIIMVFLSLLSLFI